jgi:transmembrane serine protease 3
MAKFSFVFIAMMASLAVTLGQSCGQSPSMRPNRRYDPDGQRIVGGVEARPGSHPWIVSLQMSGRHFCGGTLISVGNAQQTDIIVTAAHCVADGFSGVSVSAGAHDLNRPTSNQQTVRGARAVYHPQYDPQTTLNDIAVIKLASPIRFSTAVQPACLPSSGERVSENNEATVAGWGLTREGGYDTSSILMQVGVPIIGGSSCAASYRPQGIRIDDNAMICAGYRQGG